MQEFRKRHPEIILQPASGLKIEGLGSEIGPLMMIAGGIAPDVLNVNFRKVDSYVRQGFLYPLDEFIAAGTRGLGLKVEKSWMKAVRFNLQVTLDLGAMVAEFPLPDDAEPAPVFRA